jgi:DNA-binding NtrC family response regulator
MKASEHNLIFIVEDNEMYSFFLDFTLSNKSTCRFIRFKTGEECIENLYLNPMMVILDYSLPGINGEETLKKIKEYNSEIPVVIHTGNKDVHVALKLLKDGASNYILKEGDAIPEIEKIVNVILEQTKKRKQNTKFNFKIFLSIISRN